MRDIEKIERKLIMKTINPRDFAILFENLSKINDIYSDITLWQFKILINIKDDRYM